MMTTVLCYSATLGAHITDYGTPFRVDMGNVGSYRFTGGIPGTRYLPTAEYGNGVLTYTMSPTPSNGVTFDPGPPARFMVAATAVVVDETSYTLVATDADGDIGTMTVNITILERMCPNSAAVSGYADSGIVDDCEALLASRDALSGSQSLNWSEHLSIDSWQGVEIADNRVVTIDMYSLGLSGTIPAELANLANLQRLDLLTRIHRRTPMDGVRTAEEG